MTHARRALALTLMCLAIAPALATAAVGDYHTITGSIALWGPNRFGEQIAMVHDSDGRRWVARFAPGTLPAGAVVGTELVVFGRETAIENEVDVLRAVPTTNVSALPSRVASGWAVVPGSVQGAAGTTALLRAPGGGVVTVDLSQLDAGARTLIAPGRGVTVVGVYRTDGILAAQGVATNAP